MTRWIAFLSAFLSVGAAEFHVSPGATGIGTSASHGSLSNALVHTGWASSIAPGDMVWLHGGTYYFGTGIVNMAFSGSAGNLVTWKAYPYEYPIVEVPVRFQAQGYHRFWGIEWTDRNKTTREEAIGSFDSTTQANLQLEWINCIFHDLPGVWTGYSGMGLKRGNIIWYSGQHRRDHITYPGIGEFTGNIIYWTSGNAIELGYGGMNVSSNIFVGTGITVNSAEATLQITQGTNGVFRDNLIYDYLNLDAKGMLIQASSGSVIAGNKIAAPSPLVLNGATGHSYTITNNTFFASRPVASFVVRFSTSDGTYTMDQNGFWHTNGAVVFSLVGVPQTFAEWKLATSLDANSVSTNSANPPDSVTVMPNADDKFRTHVGICNWSQAHNVTVNLAGVIQAGNTYTVRSVQNYAQILQSGTFNGTSISIPMTNRSVAPVLYGTNALPSTATPNFDALVVIAGGTKSSGMTFSGGVLK